MKTLYGILLASILMGAPLAHAKDSSSQKPADDLDALQQVLEAALLTDDGSMTTASQTETPVIKTATVNYK